MKEGRYQVSTPNYVFDMEVTKNNTLYDIMFGNPSNPEGPCMDLRWDASKPSVLIVNAVKYEPSCATGKEMERGSGTIEMIQTCLKLLFNMQSEIKRAIFRDVSEIYCDETMTKRVHLNIRDLMIYGASWYQRHLGAKPLERAVGEVAQHVARFMKRRPKGGIFSFFETRDEGTHDTWHSFFMTKREDCMFFYAHQREVLRLLKASILYYSEWYINRRTIESYLVKVQLRKKKQAGGAAEFPICIGCSQMTFDQYFP